jgi:hypothetical protein
MLPLFLPIYLEKKKSNNIPAVLCRQGGGKLLTA